MKLVIFGATRMVGKHLITLALQKDHHVRAFGRNVFELPDQHENLELIRGTVFDRDDVLNAVSGCDAVISAVEGATDVEDKTRSLGIKIILAQMKKAAVKRIISLGDRGVLEHPEGGLLMDDNDYPRKFLPVAREYKLVWEHLQESGLDWTFVCPPDIVDTVPNGNFVTAVNQLPEYGKNRISAGDLAYFMLDELEDNRFIQQRVGISAV